MAEWLIEWERELRSQGGEIGSKNFPAYRLANRVGEIRREIQERFGLVTNYADANQSITLVGLSRREWFAGMALHVIAGLGDHGPETAADRAVAYANALIERLKQP